MFLPKTAHFAPGLRCDTITKNVYPGAAAMEYIMQRKQDGNTCGAFVLAYYQWEKAGCETVQEEAGRAYVDGIYYCPHHPHKGYEGEIPELKIDCSCRKPKPGMLLQAAEDFHIDLAQSWMIGDGENDVTAGKQAGCRTILLSTEQNEVGQTKTAGSLQEAVNEILD